MTEKVKNKSGLLDKIFKILFNIVIFFVCVIAFILVVYVIKYVPEYRQYEKSIRHYEKYLQNMKSINSGSKNPQRRLNKR